MDYCKFLDFKRLGFKLFFQNTSVFKKRYNKFCSNLGNYYQLWSDFDLCYLDAKDNLITSLEYLSLLPSLQVVDLSLNKISVVEAAAFANKSNLRRVDLSSNDIERLPLSALSLDLRPKSK